MMNRIPWAGTDSSIDNLHYQYIHLFESSIEGKDDKTNTLLSSSGSSDETLAVAAVAGI